MFTLIDLGSSDSWASDKIGSPLKTTIYAKGTCKGTYSLHGEYSFIVHILCYFPVQVLRRRYMSRDPIRERHGKDSLRNGFGRFLYDGDSCITLLGLWSPAPSALNTFCHLRDAYNTCTGVLRKLLLVYTTGRSASAVSFRALVAHRAF